MENEGLDSSFKRDYSPSNPENPSCAVMSNAQAEMVQQRESSQGHGRG